MSQPSLRKDECNYLDVARFVGIYFVILIHFWYRADTQLYAHLITSFVLPLFFMVSGVLHRQQSPEWQNLKNLIYSLLLPYAFYYALGVAQRHIFLNAGHLDVLMYVKEMFRGNVAGVNVAIWFFIALFFHKLVSMFLTRKWHYIAVSVVCILILILTKKYLSDFTYRNTFKLESSMISYPFFAFGYLIRDKLEVVKKNLSKVIIIVLTFAADFLYVSHYGGLDMMNLFYHNIVLSIIIGSLASVGIIYLSQLLTRWVKSDFVMTLSRGTMFIVGIHLLIISPFIAKRVVDHPYPLVMLYAFVVLAAFYFPIKFLYNRIPFLFGKRAKKK